MKQIPDGSVDLVLTDPPYGIKYRSNMRAKSQKFSKIANDDNETRFLIYPEVYRALKNNSVAVVFASWKNYADDYIELKRLFNIKNAIIWYKRGGGIGDLKHTLLTDYEVAIVCHKGKCQIRGKRDGSVWDFSKVNPNKMVHPTQKPEQLLKKIIEKYSDEGDTVLDCFMGSGSTGVACINTGRNFIGIELDEHYYEVAERRIAEAAAAAAHGGEVIH
jgi:site-specific DNA-methyltransferase (adenine-specific)